jgi:hypothetical protein
VFRVSRNRAPAQYNIRLLQRGFIMSDLWTVKETAEYFKVTERCIHNWCVEKKLTKKRFSKGVVRITYESIQHLYNSAN